MDTTPNLALPYLFAAQAQKHVTHNEALRALDAVVNISVLDRSLASPPLSPAGGARYIVAAAATGAWTGASGRIAAFQDGAWAFYIPREGWLAWVADEDELVVYDGAAWVAAESVNPTPLVGVNTTADATNRLAVSAPAILLNHAGAGHQAKINKNHAADTASFLFQTGFSGRAEMGTTGDDNFHFKVSPDGAAWNEAIVIDRTTGVVTMPLTPANTASNVNVGGVGVFKQKTGVNLEFRGVNAGSGAISVALDAANNEIDVDVPNDGITNAKLANVATQTLKDRTTAATGDPEDLTAAQARTLLNVADGANNYVHPNHSGDVTSVADGATTIVANAVTYAKMQDVSAASRLLGRGAGVAGDPQEITLGAGLAMTGTTLSSSGGGGSITTQDEGVTLSAGVTTLNFTGAGVTASGAGATTTVTIPTYTHPNHSGDVTSVADGATTIANDAVTNAKLANVATATLKGRTTALTGDPEDLTAAQARTLLNVADGANNYVHPNHSGDVTSVADGATTIVANAVTNTKLADVPTATLKGRTTAATGDPEDLTAAQARTLLNVADGANNYVHPNHSGDVTSVADGATTIVANAVTNTKLADVPTATLKGRVTAATGDPEDLTVAQAKTLLNLAGTNNGDQTITLTGDVTGTGTGSFAATVAGNAVTYAKMQDVSAASRLLGRGASAAGDPEEIVLGAGLTMTGTTLSSSGGGGGTPGGSDTQVQFNNAGAFGGAAGLTYSSATQITKHAVAADLESQASPPAAPATGSRLFSRPQGGRQLPSFRNVGNVESAFQTFLGRNRVRLWSAQGNSATVALIGLANTSTGTATNRTSATTNLFSAMARIGYVSAATAGASAGTRHGFAQFFMGNGTAGVGGFHYVARFGVSDAATVANARMFVGLSSTVGVFANADPSTLFNQIGLGCDAGQTTRRIMHNDGTGVSTLIDLGANFPTQTLSVDMYELQLYCAPNGSTVGYRVERLNTGDVATGTISTDLPTNTTLLGPQIWRNNGATALAVGIDVVSQYLETDY